MSKTIRATKPAVKVVKKGVAKKSQPMPKMIPVSKKKTSVKSTKSMY